MLSAPRPEFSPKMEKPPNGGPPLPERRDPNGTLEMSPDVKVGDTDTNLLKSVQDPTVSSSAVSPRLLGV